MLRAAYLDDRWTTRIAGSDLRAMLLTAGYECQWQLTPFHHVSDVSAWEHPEWAKIPRPWWKFWGPRREPTGYRHGGRYLGSDSRIEIDLINTELREVEVTIVAKPTTWGKSTLDVDAVVVYQVSTGKLISIVEFNTTIRSKNSDFTVQWPKSPASSRQYLVGVA